MRCKVSIDDGHVADLRVGEMLKDWGLKGTFFIPTVAREISDEDIQELAKFHAIGGHTVTHPMDMKLLNDNDLAYELQESKVQLEKLIGRSIDEFCYPRGRYDDRVKEAVKAAGYTSARTTKVLRLSEPEDPFAMETSIHFLPTRIEYAGQPLLKLVQEGLEIAKDQPNGYFHLWLHSVEIIRLDLWKQLNLAFGLMKSYEDLYS